MFFRFFKSACLLLTFISCYAAQDLNQKIRCIEKRIVKNQEDIQQAQMIFAKRSSELNEIKKTITHSEVCSSKDIIIDRIPQSLFQTIDSRIVPVYSPYRFESFNGRAHLEFHGWLEFDDDFFFNASGLTINDGIKSVPIIQQNTAIRLWLNRLQPMIEGGFGKYTHFFINPDFGQSQRRLFDAYFDIYYYRMAGIRVGKQLSLVTNYLNYAYPQLMYTSQPGFTTILGPNRETGFVLQGSMGAYKYGNYPVWDIPYGFKDWFSYQIGILNGTADDTNPGLNPVTTTAFSSEVATLSNKAFEARIFSNPFIASDNVWIQNLGLGISTSTQTVNNEGILPALISPGLNPIFVYQTNVNANGPRTRFHPHMYWYTGPFAIVADYTQTLQHLTPLAVSPESNLPRIGQLNSATEVNIIYNLTSEKFEYSKMVPNRDFRPLEKGAIGAWQMTFRWSALNLDKSVFQDYTIVGDQKVYTYSDPRISVQSANVWSVTLKWFWNQYVRLSTEYDHTNFVGGCSTGGLNAPINPGCLTAGLYATASSSQVLNRPVEHLFMERLQIFF